MQSDDFEVAIFAMGCFWCGESEFRNHSTHELLPGIKDLVVGYAGGTKPNPTYENHHGYKEAIKIYFDPQIISYTELLNIFWHNIDPYDPNGQFSDKGFSYTSAIFYTSSEQKLQAEQSKQDIEAKLKHSVVTEIIIASTFYDAEDYHQNFAEKNPAHYMGYRNACGRDQRLDGIWKPNEQ